MHWVSGWSPEHGEYRAVMTDNYGHADVYRGHIEGDRLVFESMEGAEIGLSFTWDASGPGVITWRNEMAIGDGSWLLIEEYANGAGAARVVLMAEAACDRAARSCRGPVVPARRSGRRECWVSRLGAALIIAGAAAAVYFGSLRRWHLNWGATPEEAGGKVAGDELIPEPDIVSTRVVEIDAPPSAIWPWLVQMGPGRGGAYTYDWIERRLGIDIRNTGRVIPELQHLKVGDEIPMPGYAMRVERLDPGRAMVVRSSNHAWVWSFELRPAASTAG